MTQRLVCPTRLSWEQFVTLQLTAGGSRVPYIYNLLMRIRDGIQNIPDWCRHLYSSCGIAKHRYQQDKLWIPGSTAETCEDVSPNFGENHDKSPPHTSVLTQQFLVKYKLAVTPTHRTPLIWEPVTSSYFQNWNWRWKDAGLISLRRSRPNRRVCLTPWQKITTRKRSKNEGDSETGVYMREGTTSRVMAADRTYGKFYDFYSVSPEYLGYTLVYILFRAGCEINLRILINFGTYT
jgi:hypothetical protein